MTEQELHEKIINIIKENGVYNGKSMHRDYYVVNDEELADALIAAGIGDVKDLKAQVGTLEMTNIFLQAGYDDAEGDRLYWVNKYKEAEHRADVAERALRNAAPRLNCRGGLGKGFYKVDKCDYYHCNNDDGCVKAHLDQAEKELAEERKDE